MILVLDNHDSFTWNVARYLVEIGGTVRVEQSDSLGVNEALAIGDEAVLIAPGPGRPADAGISLDLVHACIARGRPLLGICLGHQVIGEALGAGVVRAPQPMHGKVSAIRHDGTGLFAHLPSPFDAARYHSLTLERGSLPADLAITAEAEDGTIQAIRHRALPIFGVQFHPESVASQYGHEILRNFMGLAQGLGPLRRGS